VSKLKFLGWYSVLIIFWTILILVGDLFNGIDPGESAIAIGLLIPVLYYVFDTVRR